MPRQWLSFWHQKTRGAGAGGTSSSDPDIYVPYGQDKLAKGDAVYRVAVEEGELWFFGRVIVGRMAEDPEHAESLDVWAEPGTETTWCEDECMVDERVVDELVYLDADGPNTACPGTNLEGW